MDKEIKEVTEELHCASIQIPRQLQGIEVRRPTDTPYKKTYETIPGISQEQLDELNSYKPKEYNPK